MPELLIELFSEEIPARMQAGAARDLERMAREKLKDAGLEPETLATFAGPRRLALSATGLPAAQADRTEERKGPRVGAPDAAIEGFLRSTGLTRDQLVEKDGAWFATLSRQGRPTADIVAEMLESIVRNFPWPKSMTWGLGTLRWVRPLKRILCVFDGQVVPMHVDGIAAGDLSEGHRYMGPGQPFRATTLAGYREELKKHAVILDVDARKSAVVEGARRIAAEHGLEWVEDEGLLEEVAGLAEWPTPVLGDMDPSFLDLPPEVIRTSMRTHLRFFTMRDPRTGRLAPNFLTVANIEASDGGKEIARGNSKVLSARLSDAQFFWSEDRKAGFGAWARKLEGVTFHAKLGTMAERSDRIVSIATALGDAFGADEATLRTAAGLAKADLASQMVGEFPELQGLMGGYYAKADGLPDEVADAIRDHYRPQGPSDEVPTAAVSAAVAVADKIDTLVGFHAIGERPTGSRDPYALRRAALGLIRILLKTGARIGVKDMVGAWYAAVASKVEARPRAAIEREVAEFLADRLKVQLREQGAAHDLVDAVFALGDDDLVRIVARVEALGELLRTEDGANLLAGFKRSANILKAEAKAGPLPTGEAVDMPGAPEAERALVGALEGVRPIVAEALGREDFAQATRSLAGLRAPVDRFFKDVLVNSKDAAERDNRLRLLAQVQGAMGEVADFSLISG